MDSKQFHQSSSPRGKYIPSDGGNASLQVLRISPKHATSHPGSELEGQNNVGNYQSSKANQASQQSPGGPNIIGNLNNPYLSYYKMRQDNIHQQQQNKSQVAMQRNVQFSKQAQGQTSGFKSTGV